MRPLAFGRPMPCVAQLNIRRHSWPSDPSDWVPRPIFGGAAGVARLLWGVKLKPPVFYAAVVGPGRMAYIMHFKVVFVFFSKTYLTSWNGRDVVGSSAKWPAWRGVSPWAALWTYRRCRASSRQAMLTRNNGISKAKTNNKTFLYIPNMNWWGQHVGAGYDSNNFWLFWRCMSWPGSGWQLFKTVCYWLRSFVSYTSFVLWFPGEHRVDAKLPSLSMEPKRPEAWAKNFHAEVEIAVDYWVKSVKSNIWSGWYFILKTGGFFFSLDAYVLSVGSLRSGPSTALTSVGWNYPKLSGAFRRNFSQKR